MVIGTGIDEALAWALLLAARAAARGRRASDGAGSLGLGRDAGGRPSALARDDARSLVTVEPDGRWAARGAVEPDAAALFDLYLPVALAHAGRPFVVGQLGVSLDGQIATGSGRSHYITGPETIRHLHRLRALVDAVIVGAGTVEHDDPELTTRLVPGGNPVRVVIDPRRRLPRRHKVFSDHAAATIVLCAEANAAEGGGRHGAARLLGVPAAPDGLAPDAVLARLRSLGLHSILVEGGGVTVSRFLAHGRLDRLHLMVAPLLVGAGRPGLALPPIDDLAQARRPRYRLVRMGQDVLFDCEITPAAAP